MANVHTAPNLICTARVFGLCLKVETLLLYIDVAAYEPTTHFKGRTFFTLNITISGIGFRKLV